MENHNDYHFSFFRPTTDNSRRNRNLIVQFFLIWAVSIFGFQILLRVLQKPTPEPAYAVYQQYWDRIGQEDPDPEALRQLSHVALSVLGKIDIKPEYRDALDRGLSWMVWRTADSLQQMELATKVTEFEAITASADNILDAGYIASKEGVISLLRDILLLHPEDVRAGIAPLEIHSAYFDAFDEGARASFSAAMDLYLIHNQSILTDFRFLGFPFHYFYSAVFLLVLFVGLCLLYCIRTDVFHRKYNIID